MHIHPALLLIWAVVSAALVAVMVYRATLTQHETDQLFLNDETTRCLNHQEHDRILARVDRIRPVYQGLCGVTLLMSVLIAGIYVAQVLPQMTF
ncbi:MAG: hypothetical protein ACRYFU_09590 [Janthinobacterium lividum]